MFRCGIFGLLAFAFAASAGVASAGEMNWRVQSESDYVVHLQFYSDDRNVVWPGSDKVYVLDDSAVHEYPLSCNSNEKICYGAWEKNNQSSYWGAGIDAEQDCEDCCYRCDGGKTPIMVLNK